MKLFNKRLNNFVGIDVSSTAIKLLELSQVGSKHRVEGYGVVPLPPGAVVESNIKDIEGVSDSLKKVLIRSKTKISEVAVAVSAASVISKIIPMMANLSERDLEIQISVESSNHIPYPIEEVSYDFCILGPTEKNSDMADVLLTACRAEHIDARIEVLESVGLTPNVIDVESYAAERSAALLVDPVTLKDENYVIAVVDIGATMTTMTVLNKRNVIYTRQELFGGMQLTEDIRRRYGLTFAEAGLAKKQGGLPDDYIPEVLDPFKEAVVPQVRRSLQFFFSGSHFSSINQIILAGGTASIPGLAELIQERLEIKTVIANPFSEMLLSTRINASALSADAPALMVACGLALRGFRHGPH